jgi:hypothetical protein
MGAENGLTQTMKNGRNQNTEMLERLLPSQRSATSGRYPLIALKAVKAANLGPGLLQPSVISCSIYGLVGFLAS